MAGQIPLDPSTMALTPNPPALQALRALRSCEAVATAVHSSTLTAALAQTVFVAREAGPGAVQQVHQMLTSCMQVSACGPRQLLRPSATLILQQQAGHPRAPNQHSSQDGDVSRKFSLPGPPLTSEPAHTAQQHTRTWARKHIRATVE